MACKEPANTPPVIVAVNAVSDLGIMWGSVTVAAAVVFVEMKDVMCLVLVLDSKRLEMGSIFRLVDDSQMLLMLILLYLGKPSK